MPKVERKEDNKSAYIVIYDENGSVLVGVKRTDGNIKNNPGQHVFPGGTDSQGSLRENAEKELDEELGLSIVEVRGESRLSGNGGQHKILSSETNANVGSACGAIFLKVSTVDLNKIADNFKKTKEIERVKICSREQAIDYFREENINKQKGERVSLQTGWFTRIASNFPYSSMTKPRPSMVSGFNPLGGVGKPIDFSAQKASDSPEPMPKSSNKKPVSQDSDPSDLSDSPKPKPKKLPPKKEKKFPWQNSDDSDLSDPKAKKQTKRNRPAPSSDSDDELRARALLEVQRVREAETEQKLQEEARKKIAKNQHTGQGRKPEDQSRHKDGKKPR